ncbi:Dityrosine transporter 1 [Onygenales sp. PD_12]|nr:Dityrosine transporter 1 [Onygenales sp. PD_12]KAK2798376.1 Dityrosine transporter 1 [Onygenales sp. PD_10]
MTSSEAITVPPTSSDKEGTLPQAEEIAEGTISAPPPPPPPYTAFSPARKNFILAILISKGFVAPVSGGIYFPLLPVIATDLKVSAALTNLTVTVFMLTFAVAPLLFASFSDALGRKPIFVVGLLINIAANVLLASLPANYVSFMILRVVQAFGASALYSLGAATVADIFEPKQRGRAISYYGIGPQLGPILGPVIGGAIAQRTTWRWVFWFLGAVVYGWLGNFRIGVPGVIIAMTVCGFALSWVNATNTTYATLVQPGQVATVVALGSLLRNPAAAIGAAVVDPLIRAEGFGWCFTGLAMVDLLCTGIAVLTLVKGPSWREEMEKKNNN